MIIFKKSGIYYDNEINPEHEDYEFKKVDSIIPYLAEVVDFEDNLLFRDFFILFDSDEKMIETVFGSHLGHFPIRPYLDEAQEDCVPDGREEMEHIELSWVIEQFDYNLFYEKHKGDDKDENSTLFQLGLDIHEPNEDDQNELTIYIDVHGWGKYIPADGEEENYEKGYEPPTHTSYAIEFTPINRLAHLPIKLNRYINIRDRNEIGYEEPLVEGVMEFTVFEAVGAIFSEISFCGSPKDRDERWKDIVDDVNDSKENFLDDDDNGDE